MSFMNLFTRKKAAKRTTARYRGAYGEAQFHDPETVESMTVLTDRGDTDVYSMPEATKAANAIIIARGLGWIPCMSHYHSPHDSVCTLKELFYHSGEDGFSAQKVFSELADVYGTFQFKSEYIEYEKDSPYRNWRATGYFQVTLDGKYVGKSIDGWEGALYMALLNKGRASE